MHPDLLPTSPKLSEPFALVQGSPNARVHTRPRPPYLWDPSGACLRGGSWKGRSGLARLDWARLGQGGSSAPPTVGMPSDRSQTAGCCFP